MDSGLALGVVSAFATVLVTLVGWLGYRETHRGNEQAADLAKIKAAIQAEIQPLAQQVHDLSAQLSLQAERQKQQQRDIHELTERLGRVLDRIAIVETKIEVFWKAVAMDAAKIIHSPDPRRQEVDELIEAFQAATSGRGIMRADQYNDLREILHFMRDWEPGTPSDFPIYPGEQFAAAVLLRTMDHALESSQKGRH